MLADQQRLKILLALTAAEDLCVGEVAHVLGTSVSVASHHLRKLRDLGILEDRDDGKRAYYSLRQKFVASLAHGASGVSVGGQPESALSRPSASNAARPAERLPRRRSE